MNSPHIQKLIDMFSKFPTIGPKTAARFVFYLIGLKKTEADELASAISELKRDIKICSFCFNPFEGEGDLCQICANPVRDKSILCVVEKEPDLSSIEKTKKYNGRYFILGGTVSRLKKADVEKLKIKDLETRVKNNPEIREIILAINPTADGEATTLYLERFLKSYNKKITRLGLGLPIGGELEYADEETLSNALEGRK
ncbi:MAG: recombination mediator RecR [Patescibacteria group bacterium]